MGLNFFNTSKRTSAKTGRSSLKIHRTSSNSSDRPLHSNDIDEIYKLVNHLKQTNLGGHMLEEFVVRQSEEFLNDEHPSAREAASEDTFPIKSIQIGGKKSPRNSIKARR